MSFNKITNTVLAIFLGASDQLHGIVDYNNFVAIKYLINEDKNYYLNKNYLCYFELKYCLDLEVEENIKFSGYILQHKSISHIDFNNKSLPSKQVQMELKKAFETYCHKHNLNLLTGEPNTINRFGFSKKLKKFVQTADDKTSENIEYYIFLKKDSNSEIEQTIHFYNYKSFYSWVYENDIIWLG